MNLNDEDKRLWRLVTKSVASYHDADHKADVVVGRPMDLEYRFDSRLDLHGYTLEQAHRLCAIHVRYALDSQCKQIKHITGKSGQISTEYETWMKQNPSVKKIVKLNDGGAWEIWLK